MHPAAWTLQQVSFFAFGIALWAPVTERFAPAPMWFGTGAKCLYMLGVWSVGLTLANIYWFAGSAFYPSHTAAARSWGLSPMQDQANAATVMMATHCLLAFGAITVLFFRQSREDSLQQRLIEAGLDPDEVRWTVRYGDSAALARAAGVSLRDRPGID
jgi:cytochrome c oxidase assembly factor CtaG